MKLLTFDSYEKYVAAQRETYLRKKDNVWATGDAMSAIAEYCRRESIGVSKFLCHGVRTGWEVQAFHKKFPDAYGTGTDLFSYSPLVLKHDFHESAPWLAGYDLVYSNALDHAYDPQKAANAWVGQLSPEARLFVEWSEGHTEEKVRGADCFGATLAEYT